MMKATRVPEAGLTSRNCFRWAFEAFRYPAFFIDPNGRIAWCNQATLRHLKKTKEEVIGRFCWKAIHGSEKPASGCPFERVKVTHKGETLSVREGEQIFEVAVDPVFDDSGNFIGVLHTLQDITERKKIEEALEIVVKNVPTAVFIGYADWTIKPQNPEIESLTGHPVDDFTSGTIKWSDLILPEDLLPAKEAVIDALRNGSFEYTREYRILCPSGEIRWIRERSSIILGRNQMIESIVGFFHDVTQEINEREENKKQALRDALTGLFNRYHMKDFLEKAIARASFDNSPIGFVMLVLDHFRNYNNTFGHDAADVVLSSLGTILMNNIRPGDTACRYGGEEFFLVLPGASVEITRKRAEEVLEKVRELDLWHRGRHLGKVTISAGTAHFPENGKTVEDMIHAVDQALLEAKRQGRDRVVVAEIPAPETGAE